MTESRLLPRSAPETSFVVNPVVFGDDPIFALSREAAGRIARGQHCIDATLGVLMEDDGTLAVLPTLIDVLSSATPAEWAAYSATTGPEDFCAAVIEDCLGKRPALREHAVAVATPGATGALRNAMTMFLDRGQACLSSSLCWSVYSTIALAAERRLTSFSMFDRARGVFDARDLDRRLGELLSEQGRALLLLNDPCHNPTGYSMSSADWAQVASILERHSARAPVTLVLDAVYSAFSPIGIDRALAALEPLVGRLMLLIAWSASKSFTSYGLRTGALIAVAPDRAERTRVRDTLACQCCGTWANCNRGAQRAITQLLTEPSLRSAVDEDRARLIDLLGERSRSFASAAADWTLPRPTYSGGFFTSVFTDAPERVASTLRAEGVYVVPLEGVLRIALSSVRTQQVSRLARKVAKALERESNGVQACY